MRENTPPRVPDIEDDEGEVIRFDNDEPPPEDEDDGELDLEMEEVTLEELEARLEGGANSSTPVQDDAMVTFAQHEAPVFACALHPQQPWAATGGEDDTALLWERNTGDMLQVVGEHRDTITEVRFSHDGTYLATGDMAGVLVVHKLQESSSSDVDNNEQASSVKLRKVWEYSMGDMAWLRWHRAANVLLAGSESGEVYVWRIPSGDCKILPGVGERCETGELSADGKKLFTGYTSGALKLWDLKSGTVLMEVNAQHPMAHQDVVTTVACDKESPLYMSGGQDGKVLFCSNNGPVGSVDASGPVECVAFSPCTDLKMAATGTLHGQIAIWDFTKYSLRTLCEHPEMDDGITRLKWLSNYTLVAATIQGNIYGYDARSGLRKFTLSGHRADVYDFCYHAEDSILLSVSEDHTAKIFHVPQLGD